MKKIWLFSFFDWLMFVLLLTILELLITGSINIEQFKTEWYIFIILYIIFVFCRYLKYLTKKQCYASR